MQVVVAPPALHWQSFRGPEADGSLTGEIRVPLHSLAPLPLHSLAPLPLDARRVIAHRAMLEIDHPHCLVNLGVGMPEVGAWLGASFTVMASLPASSVCPPGRRERAWRALRVVLSAASSMDCKVAAAWRDRCTVGAARWAC